MKKTLLLLITLFITGITSYSQNLSNDINTIEKRYGKLIDVSTDEKISDETLMQILDPESFDLYKKARRMHVASIPLWCVSGACLASTATCFSIVAYHQTQNDDKANAAVGAVVYTVLGIYSAIATAVAIIPSTALTICSNKDFNNIVNNYNRRNNNLSLNFGATNNGIGLVLKF